MGIRFKLKPIIFLFLLGYLSIPLFSVSFFLKNDSRFPLNAQVLDGIGRQLAIIPLAPGQMYLYDIPQKTFEPNTNEPYTPFTVIFFCRSGRPYSYQSPGKKNQEASKDHPKYTDQFGVWVDVARGSLVNALGCPTGTKSCVIKKDHDDKETHVPAARSIYNSNKWSNDGGQSFTNDSDSGYKECIDGDVNCYEKVRTRKQREQEKALEATEAVHSKRANRAWAPFGAWSSDGGKTFQAEERILIDGDSGDWNNDGSQLEVGEDEEEDEETHDYTTEETPPTECADADKECKEHEAKRKAASKKKKKTPSSRPARHTPSNRTPLPFTPVN